MTRKDRFYNQAKQEGYRSRSAYKLKQLDRECGLFGPGNTVVDLGAAPGGWLQVAAEEVGETGTVVGVDFQRIDDLEDAPASVEFVRGDMTEDETKDEVREVAGGDVDVVLSDMAPNMTGEYNLDHARSVHLGRQAFDVATDVLKTGGDFAVKVFQGQDLEDFKADVDAEFQYVRTVVPEASRDSSSEVYLVGKHRLTAPVREGDVVTVTVEDEGSEGDGVAKVEGFTVFVDGAEEGDELDVQITEVKPKFAFAEPAADE
ncbi:TRAM domain-containing protein [Halorubellus sp. JP-L1]|uniref:23S rRNA (uridine(2552)-2'-O)-methyltransferase n=1 Tax=Halorubellus sp. JP-L1 TaxID=2715753 RepID=UPI00140A2004|nr:23S rRNA (uridine(2552)-2'-O)-methyltransferase [Halorubellus sp. JP-L1]NHN43518.1 TRAM domain-containing protein [Halorubellus sp. JP-L1]